MIRIEPAKSHMAFIRYSVILFAIYLTISCKNTIVSPAQESSNSLNSSGTTTGTSKPETTTGNTAGTTTGSTTGTTTGTSKPGTTTGETTTGTGVTMPVFTYKTTAPIALNNVSNMTISGDLITGGSSVCIHLMNCSNIHITKCKLQNSTLQGIQLYNCTNITIDSCFITNVQAGVNAIKSTTIKVINNQFLNMNGPFPSGNFVQFDNVNGGGNQINYNKCEDIAGVAQHPQDGLSVYQSNGLPGDSIQVIGNWIRGGQVQHDSGGAAGIVLGDVGGSYQVARNNILVNPGSVGAQVQGGNHIKIDHNTIYSTSTPFTVVGIAYGNYSHLTSTDITMSYNKVKYYNTNGNEIDAWWDPITVIQPTGWATNIHKANIDINILPAIIITMK
ncbi:right-handed parallel beta-helix repeat-containing protein [Mucilaginibacter sp. McL0603]|uniref:right-handed parallel beta-helix repeat-containing protein n=1 Tax=Mucilaginibacter sp. McL0603 TaxID=3415670 RepID=UPI003CF0AC7E